MWYMWRLGTVCVEITKAIWVSHFFTWTNYSKPKENLQFCPSSVLCEPLIHFRISDVNVSLDLRVDLFINGLIPVERSILGGAITWLQHSSQPLRGGGGTSEMGWGRCICVLCFLETVPWGLSAQQLKSGKHSLAFNDLLQCLLHVYVLAVQQDPNFLMPEPTFPFCKALLRTWRI